MAKESKLTYTLVELGYHLPYSIFGITLAIIAMGVLTFFAVLLQAESRLPDASIELFHVFHPAHIMVSAVATTAMFWKHEKRVLKAIVVGLLGSVAICSLSDIVFPYFGGLIFGDPMAMHVCALETPWIIIPFAVIGVLGGFLVSKNFERSTEYSHSAHVFLSSAASILYLLGYGMTEWIHSIGSVFLIVMVSVMIPCCVSDIAFPLACVHRDCEHPEEMTHDHSHH